MALRFADSFDHYATADILVKYVNANGSPAISAGNGRTSAALSCSSMSVGPSVVLDSQATWVVGFALKLTGIPSADRAFLSFRDNATVHVSLGIRANGHLYVALGDYDGTKLSEGTTSLTANVWNFIEIKVTINNSGSYQVRLNGVDEIHNAGSPVSGDTQNGGNPSANTIALWASGTTSTTRYVDDLYICDGTGSAPTNSFLGDVTVRALLPDGVGNYGQWARTGTDSGANWSQVDENPPNDTDFVSATSGSLRDSYAFADLSGSNTILGVQQVTKIKRTTSGSRTVQNFARLSSTDADSGSAVALPFGYAMVRSVMEAKPGGGGWSNTDVNDAEFGIRTVT